MSALRISIELPVHGVTFAQVRELARACEAAGLDGVWVPDHLVSLRPDGETPLECTTLLAALAATTTLRIGPLVLALPLRAHALLALQMRTLAALAPGRLVLGVGLGGFTYRRAARALGVTARDDAERAATLADDVARLRASVQEDAAQPVPVWLGGRSRAVLDAAARVADGWNCPFVAELEARSRELDRACAAAGRDPATLTRSVYCLAALAESDAEARRRADAARTMTRLFGDLERAHVFGTPPRALARLRELRALGVSEVVLHIAGDHASKLDAVALLARDVLPALRAG